MPRGSRPGERRGGRAKGTLNKSTREIRALAQVHGPAMIRELARLATKSESDQARVSAIKEVLDRGYGKARQAVEHSGQIGTYDLAKLSDEQIDSLERILGPLAIADGDQGGEGAEGGGEGATAH